MPLIIDTDMSFDVDDVGAVCIAHALADLDEAKIIGIVYDSGYPEGVGAIDSLSWWYGRPEVPLGAYKGPFGRNVSGQYVPNLARGFPNAIKDSSAVPGAAEAYRQMLSGADNHSVVIAAIGFLTAMRELLLSPSDEISPLDGAALVALKVRKIVFQGGWYAPLHPDGRTTFNWDCGGAGQAWSPYRLEGCAGAAQYVVVHMPPTVQMIFSDIGDEIYHGGQLRSGCTPMSSPCRRAFLDHQWGYTSFGRQSWDPLVVVAAVRGPEAVNMTEVDVGYHNRVDESGANFWTAPRSPADEARQSQLALVGDASDGWQQARADATATLEQLLCSPPRLGPRT